MKYRAASQIWFVVRPGLDYKFKIDKALMSTGHILRNAPEMYSISDPEAIKQIYGISSSMCKHSWYQYQGNPRDSNLFSEADRHAHSAMRKGISHLYSMTAIKSYEPFVDKCVAVFQEHFDRFACDDISIDVQRWMQAYAFDVIGEITVGYPVHRLSL